MIFVTGDTHGEFTRFSTRGFAEQRFLSKDDCVIILGDFGGVWNPGGQTKSEEYWLDWLEDKPFTTLFLDGNHENFDRLNAEFPEAEWRDGRVHAVRPSVLHLQRGEIYDLDGHSFLVFGGARSHDIQDGVLERDDIRIREWRRRDRLFRVNRVSWWEEEMPNGLEMERALANLEHHGNSVDFVLTHTPPSSFLARLKELGPPAGDSAIEPSDVLTEFLEGIRLKAKYKLWLCGHMHKCSFSREDRIQVLDEYGIYELDGLVNGCEGFDLDLGWVNPQPL